MIGILFIFVIGLWLVIALALGRKIPKWLGITRHQKALGLVFALLVFVAPVADEVIAYPQMRGLCASLKPYEFAPGMDEKKAYGRTVEQALEINEESLWPSSVKVTRWDLRYIDTATKEPVLVYTRFQPKSGMLGVPNGSSGGAMTVLLKECTDVNDPYDSRGLPTRFSSLNLQTKSNP